MCTDARYLGGYIREKESKRRLDERAYAAVGEKHQHDQQNRTEYTQESYAAVLRAIQSELIFLQRVTIDMGGAFAGVEKMIWETFLPRLLFGKTK